MTPITSLWPCPGQGAELVTPHNYGPRPTEVATVGGGQRRTPWAPSAATRRTEEGEGSTIFANSEDGANEEIQLTPHHLLPLLLEVLEEVLRSLLLLQLSCARVKEQQLLVPICSCSVST